MELKTAWTISAFEKHTCMFCSSDISDKDSYQTKNNEWEFVCF